MQGHSLPPSTTPTPQPINRKLPNLALSTTKLTGAVDPSKNRTSHPPTMAPATCALVAMMPRSESTTKPLPVALLAAVLCSSGYHS